MSRIKAIFFIGIFLATLPFMGFPGSWRDYFLMIGGGIIAVASLSLYLEVRKAVNYKRIKKERVREEGLEMRGEVSVHTYPPSA
jgi:hypothetical protein